MAVRLFLAWLRHAGFDRPVNVGANCLARQTQLVVRLQTEPGLGRHAEIFAESQRRIRRRATRPIAPNRLTATSSKSAATSVSRNERIMQAVCYASRNRSRQWVLSLPYRLRYQVAWDHDVRRSGRRGLHAGRAGLAELVVR